MKKAITYLIAAIPVLLGTANCGQNRSLVKNTTKIKTVLTGDTLIRIGFIPGDYIFADADALDNFYLLSEGYQLKKYNPAGDSIASFNDVRRFGNPSSIDVSNPLKILAYYKNFSTIVILDRLLVNRNNINLRKANIFRVKAIATSYDNNVWLFDEQDYKLKKIDDDGKLILESNDLRMITDSPPSPSHIFDSEGKLYLYDSLKGFYVFDYYGAMERIIPVKQWSNPSVTKNLLYGFEGNILYTYDMRTLLTRKYNLPFISGSSRTIKAINGKLYVLTPDGLNIYTLE